MPSASSCTEYQLFAEHASVSFFMPYFCLKFSDPPIVPFLSRKLFSQWHHSVVIFLKYQWHSLCAYSAYVLGTEAVVSELSVYISCSLKISFQVGCELCDI